jgi:hypothetical protein
MLASGMSRRRGVHLGLTLLCAAAAACGDPDQLFRHRDAGAPPPPATGAAGAGAAGVGAAAGASGSFATGAAGLSATAGAGGNAGDAAGSSGGAAGAAGSSAGAAGAAGSSAGAAGSSAGAGGRMDAGAGDVSAACTSTPDCHCESYGGHAYKFCGAGRGYVAAQMDCVAQGMRLIRIDDEAENQWAYTTKVAKGFPGVWIGADDMATAGDWRWSDGTPFWMGKAGTAGAGPVNGLFNAWQASPAQPDDANGNEDCAGYDSGNDRWSDLPCTNHNAYICELY